MKSVGEIRILPKQKQEIPVCTTAIRMDVFGSLHIAVPCVRFGQADIRLQVRSSIGLRILVFDHSKNLCNRKGKG
jgi:hypothetical protein